MRWMLPPIEFSTGRMPCDVRPDATASNTSSNRSSATVSDPGHARCAAVSLYAPAAPWNPIFICRSCQLHEPRTLNLAPAQTKKNGHSPFGQWPWRTPSSYRPGLPAASLRPDQAGNAGKDEPAPRDGVHGRRLYWNRGTAVKSRTMRRFCRSQRMAHSDRSDGLGYADEIERAPRSARTCSGTRRCSTASRTSTPPRSASTSPGTTGFVCALGDGFL